jgi:hypothetical protein
MNPTNPAAIDRRTASSTAVQAASSAPRSFLANCTPTARTMPGPRIPSPLSVGSTSARANASATGAACAASSIRRPSLAWRSSGSSTSR